MSKGQQKSSFAGGGTLIGRRFDVKDPHQLLSPVDGDSQGWKLKVVTWVNLGPENDKDEPPVSPSYGNLNREHDDKPLHGCTWNEGYHVFRQTCMPRCRFLAGTIIFFEGKPKNPTPHTTGLSISGLLKTHTQLRFMALDDFHIRDTKRHLSSKFRFSFNRT